MFRRLRNLFLTGVLVLLPLIASVYVLWFLFNSVEKWTAPMVKVVLGRNIPGVGIIFTIIFIFLVGLFATNIIGKRIISFGERVLLKIPLFRNIYISIKKVLEGLFTSKKDTFKKAVLFEYPRKGLYQIGFITSESSPYFDYLTGEKLLNIFLPTTPNPTSGMFIMIPKEDAIILDLSVEDALKLIISGGILNPETLPGVDREER
ncbi:DUF502 domain-containing protein [Halothermothrix orenii]|uniref:Uncharacterized conserved protein n=1 Tax=Halothermothrix orenii (strain H 168 / OCM 544 / DSM 9562) TaxID=373903 RepID=B8CXI6_HALOH|nr:DUF502 domain-containing protein [Halothermothrix orenii]ACL70005.1 uncharacterized conserved protein [Halothermothrix orenii H 168]